MSDPSQKLQSSVCEITIISSNTYTPKIRSLSYLSSEEQITNNNKKKLSFPQQLFMMKGVQWKKNTELRNESKIRHDFIFRKLAVEVLKQKKGDRKLLTLYIFFLFF